MSINVKKEASSGIKWNFIGQIGHNTTQFIVSIFLARLLMPEEFGLVGMMTIFMAIANVFIDSGFSVAIIQKKNPSIEDVSTVFFFNIIISVSFYLLFFFSSGLIAQFYNEPELARLTRVISLVFLINSFGTIQATLLRKELKFKQLNLINLLSVILSSLLAIFMAFKGFGVYSIVTQSISYAFLTNALYWYFSIWRPKLIFSIKSFKELFGFGSKLLVASLLDRIYSSIDSLIIGRVFSAAQLGFFTRARATRDIPAQTFAGVLGSVVLPIFSKIDNDEDLRNYHLKFLSLVSYLVFPIMVGMFVVAKPVILVLYGEKWLLSIGILQILVFSGITHSMSVVLVQTILAKGKAGLFLKLDVAKKIVGVSGMLVGLIWGFYSFIWGVTIASLLNLVLNFVFSGRLINISAKEYLKIFYKHFIISVLMGFPTYYIGLLFCYNHFVQLFVQVGTGVLLYFFLSYMFKVDEFKYLGNMVLEKINSKRDRKIDKIE
jgi:O-antigen/teichoic acid export membrane protein